MKKNYYVREPLKPSKIKIRKILNNKRGKEYSFSLEKMISDILRAGIYLIMVFLIVIGIIALYYPEIRMEIFEKVKLLVRIVSVK